MNSRALMTALFAVLSCVFGFSQATPPSLAISIYAPEQKDAPVHIAGFRYSHNGIGMALRNYSGKAVSAVAIFGQLDTPSGCAEPGQLTGQFRRRSVGAHEELLRIGPHDMAITPHDHAPFDPATLVLSAQDAGFAYLHVQAAVGSVEFVDGTKWVPVDGTKWAAEETKTSDKNPAGLMDPELVAADAGACSGINVRQLLKALAPVTRVGFSPRLKVADSSVGKEQSRGRPHLLFRCELSGDQATCPWARDRRLMAVCEIFQAYPQTHASVVLSDQFDV